MQGNEVMLKDNAHIITKNIAKKMDCYVDGYSLAFYPSMINMNSLEIIVEIIGHAGLHRKGKIDLDKIKNFILDEIQSIVQQENNRIIFDDEDRARTEFYEIPFNLAASRMIYCYKQDDYLIPDSDPHDVMSEENKYDEQYFNYSGRFLPMIKLWCDIIQPTNLCFTSNIVNISKDDIHFVSGNPVQQKDVNTDYEIKELEYKATSKDLVRKEVKSLEEREEKGFFPFNKYYKCLVSSRTMIPMFMNDLIPPLYKNGQLISRSYYVLDLFHYFFGETRDNMFLVKFRLLAKELKGSTLVILIDLPNHFIENEIILEDKQDQFKTKAKTTTDSNSQNKDRAFYDDMSKYNLMDTDDALDYENKIEVIRKFVDTYNKIKEGGENNEFKDLDTFCSFLFNSVARDINLVFAFTDIKAFDKNYGIEPFIKYADLASLKQVVLSKNVFTKDDYKDMANSVALAHYGANNMKDLMHQYGKNKEFMEDMDKFLTRLIDSRAGKNDAKFNSLYGFRLTINEELDFSLTGDADGNEYFADFKNKKAEEKKKKREERRAAREEMRKQNPDYDEEEYDDNGGFGAHPSSIFDMLKSQTRCDDDSPKSSNSQFELDEMIGLASIKQKVKEFANFVEISKIKENANMKSMPISKHMVFMGNPGTAKTTVATMLGKILQERGLLPTANIKHVSRDDLVGKYVGWTAQLTRDAIKAAKGGILFIDEAYSLSSGEGGTNSFGMEAIDTLVNYMDQKDVREDTLIIFAGYIKEMKEFIRTNPGLKSRIGFYFEFPDYSTKELLEIAKLQAKSYDMTLTEGYIKKLEEAIDNERGVQDFGNGRFVRSVLEKSCLKQCARLMKDVVKAKNSSVKELGTLKEVDFSIEGMDDKTKDSNIGFGLR